MEPETLVTFLFKAPPEVRMIELLGSWDNFTRPYRMFHDRRRGVGHWSGCFNFTDIIFDGNTPNWSQPRSGGLKQGGTYWYYFRLDDEVEAFDDALPATSECPLLPGQLVNLLDVPKELSTSPPRSRSASASIVGSLASLQSMHTLDPTSKYAALEPPPPSKLHARCMSDVGTRGYLAHRPVSVLSFASLSTRPVTRRADSCSSATRPDAWLPKSSAAAGAFMHVRDSNEPDPAYIETAEDVFHQQSSQLANTAALVRGSCPFGSRRSPLTPSRGVDQNAEAMTFPDPMEASQDHRLSGKFATTPEFASPCFSAATLSSNGGGLNTPFRLSGGCPLNLGQAMDDKSLEDLSARLLTLRVQTEGGAIDDRRQLDRTEDAQSTASECRQAIYEPARTERALHVEASFSHAVFDELAYLGIAIL
ncbi:hypothetical protein LTR95_014211 [Oleoguttula sp. CCFEE 5521]